METLDDATVRATLSRLDGWDLRDSAIHRTISFDEFRQAIDFIVRVADLAEEANHHPELTNVYTRVDVSLTSHDAGGITERDLDLAEAIDGVVRR